MEIRGVPAVRQGTDAPEGNKVRKNVLCLLGKRLLRICFEQGTDNAFVPKMRFSGHVQASGQSRTFFALREHCMQSKISMARIMTFFGPTMFGVLRLRGSDKLCRIAWQPSRSELRFGRDFLAILAAAQAVRRN